MQGRLSRLLSKCGVGGRSAPHSALGGVAVEPSLQIFSAPPPGGMDYARLDLGAGSPWPGVRLVSATGPVLHELTFVRVGEGGRMLESATAFTASVSGESSITRTEVAGEGLRGKWFLPSDFHRVFGAALPASYQAFRGRLSNTKAFDSTPILLLVPPGRRDLVAKLVPSASADGVGVAGTLAIDTFNLLNLGFGLAIDASHLGDLGRGLTSQLAAIAHEAKKALDREVVFFNVGPGNHPVRSWIERADESALAIEYGEAAALTRAAR